MLNVSEFKQNQDYPTWQPNADELVKKSYYDKRFSAMKSFRSWVDVNRPNYQTMIDAVLKPYGDERSSSNVPLATALIELYVADAIKIPTEYNFRSENQENAVAAKALEHVWKFDWRTKKRQKQFTKGEYTAAGFGTSVLYTWYEKYTKEQQDAVVDEEGNITRDTKTIEKSDIIVKDVDINNFWLDNQAIDGIDDSVDCIYRQWISFEKFQCFKTNKLYKNIEFVSPVPYSNSYKTAITQEERQKNGDFVCLEHYWNIDIDCYMVFANGVLIREHPMMSTINGEKALPFAVRGFGYKINSIYHRGLCEALLMFNSEINNLREMALDGIRRSNTSVLALGGGLSFDWRGFSYNNEILTFDWKLDAGNFQQISGTPPNQALFAYFDRLYKDIAIYVGVDIQNIIGEPQQTAFQTNVQHEASQKRINVWLKNRDMCYERFADLHKDNLQKYFALKTAEGMLPKIEIEGDKFENGKFKSSKGKFMLEVTPEMLRGDIYVDVYTNTTMPTINAVIAQQKMEFAQALPTVVNAYTASQQAGFDLNTVIPIKWLITELADSSNLDTVSEQPNTDVNEEKKKLYDEVQGMQRRPQDEVPQELVQEQPLPTNQPQWAGIM